METDSLPTADVKPPKLRWFQFRLRSLFILTTLVAIACSWLAVEMQNERRQWAAAKAIEKIGGKVQSEPTWLGKLLRDDSLVWVTYVDLAGEETTNDVLVHLQGLKRLQDLWLDHSGVTDAGLVHLLTLGQLQVLVLDNTEVTDAGLVHLQGLKQLQGLRLESTKVTDRGLVHLQGLKQLQYLSLDNTKVTDQGVKRLQQALPKCKIVTEE
jgi:hypothetical protein